MLSESRLTGFFPFTVILTDFKCVFILISTPAFIIAEITPTHISKCTARRGGTSERIANADIHYIPVIVPCTIVPFLSSIVTVSLESFIKNLKNTMSRHRKHERGNGREIHKLASYSLHSRFEHNELLL